MAELFTVWGKCVDIPTRWQVLHESMPESDARKTVEIGQSRADLYKTNVSYAMTPNNRKPK